MSEVPSELPMIFIVTLAVYAVVLIITGIYTRKWSKDVKGFALGGRWMSAIIWGFASFTTWFSISSWMGVPAIHYSWGMSMFIHNATFPIIVATLATLLFGRRLRKQADRLGALSITDYVAFRYGNSRLFRILAIVGIFSICVAFTISQFKGLGTLMSYIFGTPLWVGVFVGAVVILIYLPIGGMAGATLSDFYEGIIKLLSVLIVLPAAIIAVGGFTGMFDKLNAIDPGLTEPLYGWFTPLNLVCFPFYYFIIYLAHPYVSRMYLALKSDSWREFFKFNLAFIVGCGLGTLLGLLGNVGRAMGIKVTPPFGADMIGVEVVAAVTAPVFFIIYAIGITVAATSTSEDWLHTTAVGIGHDLVEGIPEIPEGVKKVALTISKWTIPIIVAIAAVFTAVSPPPYLSLFLYNASVIVNSIFFLPLIFALFWKKATLPAAIASIVTSLFCGIWLFDYLWAGTLTGASPYIRNVFAIAVGFVVFIITNLIVLAIRGDKAVPHEWVKKAFGES